MALPAAGRTLAAPRLATAVCTPGVGWLGTLPIRAETAQHGDCWTGSNLFNFASYMKLPR